MRRPSILNRTAIFAAMVIAQPGLSFAQGALDDLDYCNSFKDKYATASEAVEADVAAAQQRMEGYKKDPSTLPPDVLDQYRAAVRTAAFKQWSESATSIELIKLKVAADSAFDASAFFSDSIYKTEVSAEQETKLAYMVFDIDYERLKKKVDEDVSKVRSNLAESKASLDANCKQDVVSQIFRGTIGRALLTLAGNKEAAKNEKGDIAAFVRLTTGISITDILKNGLRGGENSELAKLGKAWTAGLDSVGIGENSELRKVAAAIDPTNLDVPKQLQFKIDDRSVENAITNLTGGLF